MVEGPQVLAVTGKPFCPTNRAQHETKSKVKNASIWNILSSVATFGPGGFSLW